jgi:hypothetical protein
MSNADRQPDRRAGVADAFSDGTSGVSTDPGSIGADSFGGGSFAARARVSAAGDRVTRESASRSLPGPAGIGPWTLSFASGIAAAAARSGSGGRRLATPSAGILPALRPVLCAAAAALAASMASREAWGSPMGSAGA